MMVSQIKQLVISDELKEQLLHDMTFYNMLGIFMPLEALIGVRLAVNKSGGDIGKLSLSDIALIRTDAHTLFSNVDTLDME